MEGALRESVEGRLIHFLTCVHMEVVQESYDKAYKSTVEYYEFRKAQLEGMTDEQRDKERRRARERFRKDFGV